MKIIKRQAYPDMLIAFKDERLIKVVTGIGREICLTIENYEIDIYIEAGSDVYIGKNITALEWGYFDSMKRVFHCFHESNE